jgi:hypothetical protein
MRSFIIAAIAALAFASAASAAPHCVKGKACGNTCIKATDVCHKGTATTTTAPVVSAKPPPAAAKRCKDPKTHKFVKCGTAGAVPA